MQKGPLGPIQLKTSVSVLHNGRLVNAVQHRQIFTSIILLVLNESSRYYTLFVNLLTDLSIFGLSCIGTPQYTTMF